MTIPSRLRLLIALASLTTFVATSARAQTAPLTNSVSGAVFNGVSFTAYIVNGANNPTLTLYRGVTYVFQINNLTIHPFYIRTNSSFGANALYNNGVANQGATSGNVIFTPPSNSPSQVIYQCGNHSGMMGTLNLIDAPVPPPTGQIVLISISPTTVTMQSLGASNWTAIPEFSSNLTAAVWSTVPSYTNNFDSGTNTTTFDRLDAICGPNVFLRVRNQSN